MQVIGLDISANSPGVCVLHNDDVMNYGCVTQVKKYFLASIEDIVGSITFMHGKYSAAKTFGRKKETSDNFSARRRHAVTCNIFAYIDTSIRVVQRTNGHEKIIVVMEDYAYASQTAGQYELAEIQGLIRNYLWKQNVSLRLHDPLSTKMWATGMGRAKKLHMRIAAAQLGFKLDDKYFDFKGEKFDFPIFIVDEDGVSQKYLRDIKGPGADIVDAYHLAHFGWIEHQVREGQIDIKTLDAKKQRELTKDTKARPVPLLERPYILNTGDYPND